MSYIAFEEAFSVLDLADRQPPWLGFRFSQRHLADWPRIAGLHRVPAAGDGRGGH
jgi:hypothetical protein